MTQAEKALLPVGGKLSAHRFQDRHAGLGGQAQRQAEACQGQGAQTGTDQRQGEEQRIEPAPAPDQPAHQPEGGQASRHNAKYHPEKDQGAAGAKQAESERVVAGLARMLGQHSQDEDQTGQGQDGQDQLDHRPGDLLAEVALQFQLPDIEFLQFGEDLGQHAGLLADAGQGQEQRREQLALLFQGLLETLPFLQVLGDPAGHGTNRQRPAAGLLLEDVEQLQTGLEIMPQSPAQFDQTGQR